MKNHADPVSSLPSTSQLVQQFLSERSYSNSPKSLGNLKYVLNAFAEKYPELLTDAGLLNQFIGAHKGSILAYRTLSSFYKFVREQGIKLDPMKHVPHPASLPKKGRVKIEVPLPDIPDDLSDCRDTLMLVRKFNQYNVDRNLSKETLRYYNELLLKFAHHSPELTTNPDVIEAWVSTFTSGDERRHAAYRACRALYNWAERRIFSADSFKNPFRRMLPPRRSHKEKRPLTKEELRQLLEFPKHRKDIRVLLFTLADTGCRLGEVCSLMSSDITENSIKVHGKTGERIVPISSQVHDMLNSLGKGRLFPAKVSWYSRLIAEAFEASGLTGHAHLLRHTFASNWSGDTKDLKDICGWSSWAMVSNYAHKNIDKLTVEHGKHSPLVSLKPEQPTAAIKPASVVVEPKSQSKHGIMDPAYVPEACRDMGADMLEHYHSMQFFWHAFLSNITKQAGSVFDELAENQTLNEANVKFVALELVGSKATGEEREKEIKFIARGFWQNMAMLAKRTSAQEFLTASQHQDEAMIEGEIQIEDVQVEIMPAIWARD